MPLRNRGNDATRTRRQGRESGRIQSRGPAGQGQLPESRDRPAHNPRTGARANARCPAVQHARPSGSRQGVTWLSASPGARAGSPARATRQRTCPSPGLKTALAAVIMRCPVRAVDGLRRDPARERRVLLRTIGITVAAVVTVILTALALTSSASTADRLAAAGGHTAPGGHRGSGRPPCLRGIDRPPHLRLSAHFGSSSLIVRHLNK